MVPQTVEGHDRPAAERAAETDARWRVALEHGGDRPIQFLAGGQYLLQRYAAGAVAARAVLEAAADARRAGMPRMLPPGFLAAAAQDYLPDAEYDLLAPSARGSWVERVIETDLAIGARGLPGPLRLPRGGEGYELADYLEQHLLRERATVQPADSAWRAAIGWAEPAVLTQLGTAAALRGRFRPAAALFEAAIAAGETTGLRNLAWIYENAGEFERAAELCERSAGAWVPYARERLAEKAAAGYTTMDFRMWWADTEEGTRENGEWLGDDDALYEYSTRVEARLAAGDSHGADRVAAEAAADGWLAPLADLASTREKAGDLAGAARTWRMSVATGNMFRLLNLAGLREASGDEAGGDLIVRYGITVDGEPEPGLGV